MPSQRVISSSRQKGVALHAFLMRLIWICMWPLLALSAYLAINDVRTVQARRDGQAAELARALAIDVDQELTARIGALRILAASPLADDESHWPSLYKEAQGFKQSFDSDVVLADLSMQMRFNTRAPYGTPLPQLPRPKARAAAPLAISTASPAVGDVFVGPIANQPLVAIVVPILREGRVAGVLISTLEAQRLMKNLNLLTLPPAWTLSLRDSSGTLIAQRGPIREQGWGGEANASGQFSSALKVSAWTATLEIPRSDYMEPLIRTACLLALGLFGATLVGVLGGILAGRRLSGAVKALAQPSDGEHEAHDIAEVVDVRRLLDDAEVQRESSAETLRQSEQRFRRLFQDSPLPMALSDSAGRIVDLNSQFCSVLGYSLADIPTIEDWGLRAYADPAYRELNQIDWEQSVAKADEAGAPIDPFERQIRCKDGAVRDMVVSGLRIGDEFLVTLFDITERKRAEEAVLHGATLYRHTLDNMLEACQIIDFDWQYRYVNAAGLSQNRQSLEGMLGRKMPELYPGIEATEIFAALRLCMEQRLPQQLDTEFSFPDGSVGWFAVSVQPAPEGIVIFSVDITEKKREEDSRQRLAAIVQSSDDAIIGKTIDGVINSWNPGAEKLFGYTAAEAIGHPLTMLMPPELRSEEVTILERIRAGQTVQHFETRRLRKDGVEVDVSATISPIHDHHGRVIGASKIARDVTERKQADKRLQAQLERLQLLDQITTAIGERQDLNSIYQVLLRRLEERLPVDFACVLDFVLPDSGLRVLRIGTASEPRARQLGLSEYGPVELDRASLAICNNGNLIHEPDTSVTPSQLAQRLAAGGLRSLVLAPLSAEKGASGMLLLARSAPHSFSSGDCEFLRQLCAHVGLAAQQAQLIGDLQSANDELRHTQQAVMQQERLRALGQMASGVAHDINNAISPVLLYTETLLEHEPGLSPRARGYLETIARSIDDVAATVARLREFYRQREPDLKLVRVPLPPLLKEVVELTRARWHDMPLQRGIVVDAKLDLTEPLPDVMAVESELREALTNLIFNAVDAMPEGGMLSLGARLVTAGDMAGHVEVWVSDTGLGMDEDTRRRCMEPFFTTKGERGTGLGLAMVYGMVQRHGAEFQIDSAPGAGSTMRLRFPVPMGAGPAEPVPRLEPSLRRLRLLVVDDDPLVLSSLRETLEADGHFVLAAQGGQAGIDAFANATEVASPEPGFDAVITDLGMPHVDGQQLARAVKQRAPSVPVILVTGWGQRLISDGEMPTDVDRVLSKPPKLRELRAALLELIG